MGSPARCNTAQGSNTDSSAPGCFDYSRLGRDLSRRTKRVLVSVRSRATFQPRNYRKWRRRRRLRFHSPRNCELSLENQHPSSATVSGCGGCRRSIGTFIWILRRRVGNRQGRREFNISVGITQDIREQLQIAVKNLSASLGSERLRKPNSSEVSE